MSEQLHRVGKRRYLVLATLFVAAAVDPGALQRTATLAGFFGPELGFDPVQIGQLNVAGNIGLIPAMLLGGILATRFGPKLFLVIASVGLVVFPVAVAFVHDFTSLYVLNVVIGVCAGLITPAGALLITRWFPDAGVAGAIAVFFGAGALATVVLNPVNLAIAQNFGWREVYLIMAIPAVAALVMVCLVSSSPTRSRRISASELAFITAGKAPAAAAQSVTAGLRGLVAVPVVLLILAVAFMGGGTSQATWVWYATIGTLQIDAATVGLVTSAGFLISGLYTFIHNRVLVHVFRGKLNLTISVGGMIGTAAFLAMAFVFPGAWIAWASMVTVFVVLMANMVFGTAIAYVNSTVGPAAASTAAGIFGASGYLAGLVVGSFSGALINPTADGLAQYSPIWILSAALTLPIVVVPWLIKRVNILGLLHQAEDASEHVTDANHPTVDATASDTSRAAVPAASPDITKTGELA